MHFKYNFGTDGPGIIRGVDIYFNTAIGRGNWHVPEPSSVVVLALGGLMLKPRRRR